MSDEQQEQALTEIPEESAQGTLTSEVPALPAVPDYVIARMCHEINRIWCKLNGDDSQQEWEDAPDWQRTSALKGVRWRLENPDAPESAQHEAWLADKKADGWKWGAVKDPVRREHPCFLPYKELPTVDKKKDALFVAIVNALK